MPSSVEIGSVVLVKKMTTPVTTHTTGKFRSEKKILERERERCSDLNEINKVNGLSM